MGVEPHVHDCPLVMSVHRKGFEPPEPDSGAQRPFGSHGQATPVVGSVQGGGASQVVSNART